MTGSQPTIDQFRNKRNRHWLWFDPLPDWLSAGHGDHAQSRSNDERGVSLLQLLDTAGLLQITSVHLAHPGLEEAGTRLHRASSSFMLDPQTCLDKRFWTSPYDLWNGTIAKGLQRTEQGFLCTYADTVGTRGLFWKNAGPVRIEDPLSGDLRPGGPYLVAMACEKDVAGNVRLTSGYAQAVLSAAIPFPITTAIERQALEMLVALCEQLEAGGYDTMIARSVEEYGLSDLITFTVSHGTICHLHTAFICKAHYQQSEGQVHRVTPETLKNHTWLSNLLEHPKA